MKKLLTIIAALAVSASFVSAADAPKKGAGEGKKGAHNPEENFKKLDTNNDGFLSLDEFKAGPMGKRDPSKAEDVFKKRDTNGDGKLSAEEFAGARHGKKGEAAPAGKDAPAAAPASAVTPAAAPEAK